MGSQLQLTGWQDLLYGFQYFEAAGEGGETAIDESQLFLQGFKVRHRVGRR